MAKKKSTSISDLIKNNKKAASKLSIEEINQAAKNIQSDTKSVNEPIVKKQETKRLSVDTPKDLYVKLKSRVAEEGTTVRSYIVALMRKDLE